MTDDFDDDGIFIMQSIVKTIKLQLAAFGLRGNHTKASVVAKLSALRATANYFVKSFNAYRIDLFGDPPLSEEHVMYNHFTSYEDVNNAIEQYEKDYIFSAESAANVRDAIYNYNAARPKHYHLMALHAYVHQMKNTTDEGQRLSQLIKLTLPEQKVLLRFDKSESKLEGVIDLVDQLVEDPDNVELKRKLYMAGMKHAWNLMKGLRVSEHLCEMCQTRTANYIESDSCRLVCGIDCIN